MAVVHTPLLAKDINNGILAALSVEKMESQASHQSGSLQLRFKSFRRAQTLLAGIELSYIIRKGQY